ncbi:MAG: hypothetical protein HYY55_02310 [Candidatus Niyogibacteria bacterium]|nr:MAG: hypothetical protein HYY55_02310 [Candidatus Niyogibacteria bacterium]
MKYVFYILAALVALALLSFFTANLRVYPLINVNGSSVWAGKYYDRLSGLEYYRRATLEPIDEETAKRGIIISLIMNELIESELETRGIDRKEAKKRVEAAWQKAADSLENASRSLYGWSVDEFKEFALLPQARQDILSEVLREEGGDFNEWLNGALVKADVKIYSLPYEWTDGVLVKK